MTAKSVSFAQPEHYAVIPPLEPPMSPEEEVQVFFSQAELTSILIRCKEIARGDVNGEDSLRGLELLMEPSTGQEENAKQVLTPPTTRPQQHITIVRDILQEQNRLRCIQDEQGTDFAQDYTRALAEMAQAVSSHRLKLAQLRGVKDARDAIDCVWDRPKAETFQPTLRDLEEAGNRRARRRAQRAARVARHPGGRPTCGEKVTW